MNETIAFEYSRHDNNDNHNHNCGCCFFVTDNPLSLSTLLQTTLLYKLKDKVDIYKSMSGIFNYRCRFVSVEVYFLVNKNYGVCDLETS